MIKNHHYLILALSITFLIGILILTSFSQTPLLIKNKKRKINTFSPVPRTVLNFRGQNNCLFDACRYAYDCPYTDSQTLRDDCNLLLKEENLPIIPDGQPAGEGYLYVLSKILNRKINVIAKDKTFLIQHSSIDDNTETINIKHVGSAMNGHWTV